MCESSRRIGGWALSFFLLSFSAIAQELPPRAQQTTAAAARSWDLTIASWNLLNIGSRKVGLPPYGPLNTNLLARYASILSRYDIVVIQELLDDGSSLTNAIANQNAMANYNCTTISTPSGRAGRLERYGICYVPSLVTLLHTDDWADPTVHNTAIAVNGSNQTPQNVWMRPPLVARFRFVKPNGVNFDFDLTTNHTKPAYSAGARPPGTPVNAPANQSVRNELTALESNDPAAPPKLVLGDLNVDCASYPTRDRNANYTGRTWYINYGEKTNTAPRSNCAYDRLIFDAQLNNYYREHGIFTNGINTRVDGKRVSDHYLVWTRIGEAGVKRKLAVALQNPVPMNARKFFKTKRIGGRALLINGSGFSTTTTTPMLYVIAYNAANVFSGNQTYRLTDVRGKPTPVTLFNGGFRDDVVWDDPKPGLYSLVLDMNGDGLYRRSDGDIATSENVADFLVVDDMSGHNDVVTLDDRGAAREAFNADVAENVYVLAKGLPANRDVRAYVVSDKLLRKQGFTTWEAARRAGNIQLDKVSIPLWRVHGPILTSTVLPDEKYFTIHTTEDGALFDTVWPSPSTLMNTVVYDAPPQEPDYKPEYAKDPERDDSDMSTDPCSEAWLDPDSNFRRVCNVGDLFTDYYGTAFSIVIDANENGVFDGPDKVDDHDLGDTERFFKDPRRDALDARANGDPAVSEYKEFLSTKLSLFPPLDGSNVFDAATAAASLRFLCTPSLPRAALNVVRVEGQKGFDMLPAVEYMARSQLKGGRSQFADVDVNGAAVAADARVCFDALVASFEGVKVDDNAQAVVRTEDLTVGGNVSVGRRSLVCMTAAHALVLTTGNFTVTAIAPNPFTAAGTVLFGIETGVTGALCALGY